MEFQNIEEVIEELETVKKKLVFSTIKRYEKTHETIFNEQFVNSIANAVVFRIAKKVMDKEVEVQGMYKYFQRSFINETIKEYNKQFKTDIRGGINVLSSEEAINVASVKNNYNPEDEFIITSTINKGLKVLREEDSRINNDLNKRSKEFGISYEKNDYSFMEEIINRYFLKRGDTHQEIYEALGITISTYQKQKTKALSILREVVDKDLINDCFKLDNKNIDQRLYYKEGIRLDKNDGKVEREMEYRKLFFIGTVPLKGNKVKVSLNARIELIDKHTDEKITSIKVDGKKEKLNNYNIEIFNKKCKKEELNNVKSEVLERSQDIDIQKKVENLGKNYIKNIELKIKKGSA